MPYKLGSIPYTLTDDSIRKIVDISHNTDVDKKEHAFMFCADRHNVLWPGEECTGSECHVLAKNCNDPGNNDLGDVHTHPSGDIEPSGGDLMWALYNALENKSGEYINCRTGGGDSSMSCQWIKIPQNERLRMENLYDEQASIFDSIVWYWKQWEETGVQPESNKEPEILDEIARTVRPFFKEHNVSIARLGESVNKVKQKQAGEHWEVVGTKWVKVP